MIVLLYGEEIIY